ncbi:hypothetical protein D3C75_1067660 [compost metagenome]
MSTGIENMISLVRPRLEISSEKPARITTSARYDSGSIWLKYSAQAQVRPTAVTRQASAISTARKPLPREPKVCCT